MEYRVLEIDLLSAKGLNKVNLFNKMVVYAVFSISGGRDNNHNQTTKSTADPDGDSNPLWNFPMKFAVDEAALQINRLTLDIKLVCARNLGDKQVGEVHVQIKDLLDSRPPKSSADGKQPVSYQVRKPNGKPKGELTFSYRFSDKAVGSPAAFALQYGSGVPSAPSVGHFGTAPVQAYQAGPIPSYPQPGSSFYLYPPPPGNYPYPPPGYGYPATPPPGYAYAATPPPGYAYAATPPPGYAYAAPPPPAYEYPAIPPPGYWYQAQPGHGYQAPPPKKSKFGVGLGAGLVGGAIAGLALW